MRAGFEKKITVLMAAAAPCVLLGTVLLMVLAEVPYQTVMILLLASGLMSLLVFGNIVRYVNQNSALQERLALAQKGKDIVTGLPDESEFLARLDVECRRSLREFTPISVMLVGVSSERLAGTPAIHIAETLIRAVYRPGDMVSRISETRFALILPATNERAVELAERCLKDLRKLDNDETISIGLCTFQPAAGLTAAKAISRVGGLLEQAQTEGGDRVNATAEKQVDPSVIYTH